MAMCILHALSNKDILDMDDLVTYFYNWEASGPFGKQK